MHMSTWLAYFKSRRLVLLAFLLFFVIFGVVYSLYHLDAGTFLYAALLCLVIGGGLLLWDFIHFWRRHQTLRLLLEQLETNSRLVFTPGELPAASLVEADYRRLLEVLYNHKRRLNEEMEHKLADRMTYYTLWAHQIKTPISAMHLLLQEEKPLNDTEIGQQLFQIEQYVEMVLQYQRLESLSADLLPSTCSLSVIVRQAVKKYAAVFIHKKITLHLEDMQVQVLTDEKWLTFVMEQLLSNALKYTQQGSISIYMDKNAPLTLVIEDTGIGIYPEDIPRIFERGFTGYNGRMDKKATGIGLFLCKEILSRLGHTISITSLPGKGTAVRVCMDREKIQIS